MSIQGILTRLVQQIINEKYPNYLTDSQKRNANLAINCFIFSLVHHNVITKEKSKSFETILYNMTCLITRDQDRVQPVRDIVEEIEQSIMGPKIDHFLVCKTYVQTAAESINDRVYRQEEQGDHSTNEESVIPRYNQILLQIQQIDFVFGIVREEWPCWDQVEQLRLVLYTMLRQVITPPLNSKFISQFEIHHLFVAHIDYIIEASRDKSFLPCGKSDSQMLLQRERELLSRRYKRNYELFNDYIKTNEQNLKIPTDLSIINNTIVIESMGILERDKILPSHYFSHRYKGHFLDINTGCDVPGYTEFGKIQYDLYRSQMMEQEKQRRKADAEHDAWKKTFYSRR